MAKGVKRSAAPADRDGSDGGPRAKRTATGNKKASGSSPSVAVGEQGTDGNGAPFWSISGKRRVNVSEFKGNLYVNIREFYEQNGETKPGKGIALSPEQWAVVLKIAPGVNAALAERGFDVQDGEAAAAAGSEPAESMERPAADEKPSQVANTEETNGDSE